MPGECFIHCAMPSGKATKIILMLIASSRKRRRLFQLFIEKLLAVLKTLLDDARERFLVEWKQKVAALTCLQELRRSKINYLDEPNVTMVARNNTKGK